MPSAVEWQQLWIDLVAAQLLDLLGDWLLSKWGHWQREGEG